MGEQLSMKRGVRSSAQKEDSARNQYEEMPAASQVAGAHGNTKPHKISDKDVALAMDEQRVKREREAEKSS